MAPGAGIAGSLKTLPALALATALAVTASAPLGAYEIDYSSDRPEALAACDSDYFRGRLTESTGCYSALLAGDADLAIKAEAAWALNNFEAANRYFRDALAGDSENARIRTRWGRLFAATSKAPEAKRLYDEALAIDAAYVPAIVGLAELAAAQFEGHARAFVDEALSRDPEAIPAHLLFAQMELEVENVESAAVSLDRALELVEQRGLPPVEVYALKAALDLQSDLDASPWIERALEYNPRYGGAYAIPADIFVMTRRYREAIDYYQRAVEIEPTLWSAHTELGVNLLRENRVEEAFRHLETSYHGFGYDPQTSNTLNLIDSFENFTVTQYDATTTPAGAGAGVILRLHRDESPVLTPYVLELINESIERFSERYDFTPVEPVIAELYPEPSDFSVRTAGVPGIGLLGVTFGYLVAMNSPPPGLDGPFHWGTTLWHEIAHVFTLEASDHLVPRWFSEGVSVFEEWSTGPLDGRHIPTHVLQAMSEDKFLPVADLDEGFIRPTYENQVIVSYMQAGLICEYIAASFGQEALSAMLVRFREGDDTSAALESALGIEVAEFDRRFAAHVEAEFGTALASLGDWMEAQQEMLEHANEADWAAVGPAAERAISLLPDYVDTGSPYVYLARAQREAGDLAAAKATLERYFERGGYAPDPLLQLARWHATDGEADRAIEVLEALLLVAPLDESVHAELGDLLLAARPADALREFEALAALGPHDQASLNLRRARAHLALGDRDEAMEHLLYALEVAPNYREAQQLLLEIVR